MEQLSIISQENYKTTFEYLKYFCHNNELTLLLCIISHNPKLVSYKDENQNTLLHVAFNTLTLDNLKKLLTILDVDESVLYAKNDRCLTPLYYGCCSKNNEKTEYLLNTYNSYDFDTFTSIILLQVRAHNYRGIKLLLSNSEHTLTNELCMRCINALVRMDEQCEKYNYGYEILLPKRRSDGEMDDNYDNDNDYDDGGENHIDYLVWGMQYINMNDNFMDTDKIINELFENCDFNAFNNEKKIDIFFAIFSLIIHIEINIFNSDIISGFSKKIKSLSMINNYLNHVSLDEIIKDDYFARKFNKYSALGNLIKLLRDMIEMNMMINIFEELKNSDIFINELSQSFWFEILKHGEFSFIEHLIKSSHSYDIKKILLELHITKNNIYSIVGYDKYHDNKLNDDLNYGKKRKSTMKKKESKNDLNENGMKKKIIDLIISNLD
jgi:hypothetical protein